MSSSIGIKFTLTNLDDLCKKLKYSLTVNSVLASADTNVIVNRPSDDVLHITKYNVSTDFANDDTISLSIRQGTAFSASPTSPEITYSSPATLAFTINYSVPAQPSPPSVSSSAVTLISQNLLNLQVAFTVTGIDTTATKLYHYYTVQRGSDTFTFNPYVSGDGLTITTGGANRTITINKMDPNLGITQSNSLYKGDIVTVHIAVGVPLSDNTWEFSTLYSNQVTLDIPAPTDTPATPTGSGTAYGIVS